MAEVKGRADDFTKDIRQFASNNLFDNREYVQAEAEEGRQRQRSEKRPERPEEQKEIRRGMQGIAYSAYLLRQDQVEMKKKEVRLERDGYRREGCHVRPEQSASLYGALQQTKGTLPGRQARLDRLGEEAV